MQISIENSDHGTYIITNDYDDETYLVQNDTEFPSVAKTFGWDGDERDIDAARYFLDEIADSGETVEDSGYFDHTEDDLSEPEEYEYNFEDEDETDESNPYGFV